MKNKLYPLIYPRENYTKAAPFMAYLNSNRKFIQRERYAALRKQALSGDLDGASHELGRLLEARWK